MPRDFRLIDHPLVSHKLTRLRDRNTPTREFRNLVRELGMLLAFEASRDLAVRATTVETPIQKMAGETLAGKPPALIPILRAGLGLLDGMLQVISDAEVGHIGMVRDPETLEAREYYCNLPSDMTQRSALILDPMLATGHSAIAATDRVLESRPRSTTLVCFIAAPEGVQKFHTRHPSVPIIAAALDEGLNEKGYIVPGLGDAGDRLYGTA